MYAPDNLHRGSALGFKLESLLRLADIKSGALGPSTAAAVAPAPSSSGSCMSTTTAAASQVSGPAMSAAGTQAVQRTSLLQYVVRTMLTTSPAIASLPEQLAGLKAAAGIQVGLQHLSLNKR